MPNLSMYHRRNATAFVLAIVLGHGVAIAQEAVPESVGSLSPDVQTVVSDGYWSNDHGEGFFRAVVTAAGVEHVNNELFLQWVSVDVDTNHYVVASSVGIEQINANHTDAYHIAVEKAADADFGTLRLIVTVSAEHSKTKLKYELAADGKLGSYQLMKVN